MDKCKHGFDHACLICGFTHIDGKKVWFDWAWQEQLKRIDELQARVDAALFDMNQRKLELCESCDGYKDPVGVCQSEGLEMAINILKQALKSGEV